MIEPKSLQKENQTLSKKASSKIVPFVEKYAFIDSLMESPQELQCDASIQGVEYAMKIDTLDSRKQELKLINWLVSPQKVRERQPESEEQISTLFDGLMAKIEGLGTGYTLVFSHSNRFEMDDFFQLVVPFDAFDEETVLKALQHWSEFTETANRIVFSEK